MFHEEQEIVSLTSLDLEASPLVINYMLHRGANGAGVALYRNGIGQLISTQVTLFTPVTINKGTHARTI